jgi:hypothetical protein
VIELLINLYAKERQGDESATEFFGRIEIDRVKRLLMPLERFSAEDARPDDYIDLAEAGEFAPVVMDGECSA